MTLNAGIVFSTAGKWTSSLMVAFALLSVWPISCPAESGQTAGPAPGGLEIPPLTDGTAGKEAQAPAPPPRKNVPREDIVISTEQSFGGYIGTWHDPVRDETVTTIITPQPMTQQPPIYIAPQIYPNWDGSWSQGAGQYYPPQWSYNRPSQWNQGQRPPRPPRPPHWDQGQYPSRPPQWDQGQRPPRPSHWQGGDGIPPSWWRGSGR